MTRIAAKLFLKQFPLHQVCYPNNNFLVTSEYKLNHWQTAMAPTASAENVLHN